MNKYGWLILALLFLQSCHIFRKVVPVSEAKQFDKLVEKAISNEPVYHTFKAKTKIHVTTKDLDQNATLYLQVVHDSIIWGSVTYLFGIEVMRFYITPDSAVMMDKFRQQYSVMPFLEIVQMTGIKGLDFNSLEQLMTGSLIFRVNKRFQREMLDDGFLLTTKDNFSEIKIRLMFSEPILRSYEVTNFANPANTKVVYSGNIKSDGRSIPENVDIKVAMPGENTLNLNYQTISFDSDILVNTVIPDGYKRVE